MQTVYELTKDIFPLLKGHRVVPSGDPSNTKMLWVNTNENPERKFVVRPEEILEVDS